MKYKATELAQEAGIADPKWLISRDFGRLFLPVLQEKLESMPSTGTLHLDFSDIDLLEWSFADEAIAVLCVKLSSGEFPGRYLILEGLSDTSTENLAIAIRTRPERENKPLRNLVVPVVKNGKIIPVGKLEEHLKPVWDYLAKNHQITARELSAALEMEINTASTKLKTLYDLRLLKREESRTDTGKQYFYHKI